MGPYFWIITQGFDSSFFLFLSFSVVALHWRFLVSFSFRCEFLVEYRRAQYNGGMGELEYMQMGDEGASVWLMSCSHDFMGSEVGWFHVHQIFAFWTCIPFFSSSSHVIYIPIYLYFSTVE